MPREKQKPNKVKRSQADDVFKATATEPLRKYQKKTPVHLHPLEAERIRKDAEALVIKGRNRVEKKGDQYSG